jgi:CarD family transcriptional regulator
MFETNQSLIYGSFGLCVVKRIETKKIAGVEKNFYILSSSGNQSQTFMISEDQSKLLRPIADVQLAQKAFNFACSGMVSVSSTTWNRRYREFMEKLQTGELMEIALVYRSLTVLRRTKDLSFGERKMLDQSHYRLIQEISLSLNQNAEMLENQLRESN